MTTTTQISRPLIYLFIGICVFNCQACKQAKDKTATSISIEKARSSPLGTEVTVNGTVTVASGTFSSSSPYGYALQDSVGGIYIMDSTTSAPHKYDKGMSVQVWGIITEVYGIRMIRETTSKKTGTPINPTPFEVNTGDVGPANTGLLVKSTGRPDSLVNDLPYGYKLYINDGSGPLEVFINTTTGILKDSSLWLAANTVTVTGFSSQYETTFELCPRNSEDIQLIVADKK